MVAPPSQKELLEIEQSNAEGATFIEAAARFLRIEEASLEIHPGIPPQTLRKALAPREEFVLKLLLRRLSKSDDVLNGLFWALLAHLFSIIPVKALAHLLGEREFFESLDEALEKVLLLKADEEEDVQHGTSSDEDSGRPTKKQKLRTRTTSTSLRPILLYSRVCETIASLVRLATSNAELDELSCNTVRNVLSASSEHAAIVTGKLLKIIQNSLNLKAYRSTWDRFIQDTPTMLSIWAYRRPDTASEKSSNQNFTSQCLRPALQLLSELEEHQDLRNITVCATAVKALERVVALHSVLPLRSLFLTEKGQQWKAKTQTITWHDFKDLHAVASIMLLETNTSRVDEMAGNSFKIILQYYSIAVRAVPRPTMRRIQQEQPWLDCLFCVCASLSKSSFPRMELDEAGHLVQNISPGLQKLESLNADLSKLLTLAEEKAVTLSLPVLMYLTATALEYQSGNEQWRVLTKIFKQDVNVFIPNSGLLQTTLLLNNILGLISSTQNEHLVDYQLVRDGVIRPLLNGFAYARDLRGFVDLWINGLEDAIQQRASGELQYLQSHLIVVWEDDLLFKDFEDATKALTTYTLAQSLIAEMLVLLEQAATRIGPTSDIVSHVAIATSLLTARPESLEPATLEGIITATTSALVRRADYQLQRWRFWRLLRQCLSLTKLSTKSEENLQQLVEKRDFVSLSTVSEILNSDSSYTRDARLKEALECFNLTVSRAATSPAVGSTSLEEEMNHLIALFPGPKKSKNGKSRDVHGQLQFALSCVAVVSQYSQVLCRSETVTEQLIAAMVGSLSPPLAEKDVSDLVSLLKALLSSEEILTNTKPFNDCCAVLLTSVDEHGGISSSAREILFALPLQGLKKSIAEKFADILVQRLHSNATTKSALDQILPDLGLLGMLTATFNISIGKPKKWAEFIKVAEHILNQTGPVPSKSHQSALACISKGFGILWQRCQSDEMSSDMSAGLLAFQSRLRDLERPSSSSSVAGDQFRSDEPSENSRMLRGSTMSSDMSKATAKDLNEIASHINMQVSSLGSNKSSELANLVDQNDLNSGSLLLLSAIICQTTTAEAAQDQSLLQSMSKLATLTFALTTKTAADLCLALETCKIIFEKHPSVVNQHIVDTILSSITALTSPNSIHITSNAPSAIFDRLCSLLGLLLSRHRKRLGGRYHVILPALQGLLRCLFFAGTSSTATSQTKSQVIFIRSLPSWLQKSKEALTPKSAEHFTRLLTTICDPSVSSVRRKKSNELTDETKKTKSLAGQYMQYLIMDFCRCSLHGRIPSSSKEKLMPGLYAVLDVMDRETMKGMNGAMDSNGRAVWKGLFQDWERFGRWDRR
jgi:hypothetical protein